MTHLARKDQTWSSPPRLVVWDFDLTILSLHSWTENIKPEDVASRDIREDVADLEFFQKFVCRALERDVKVAVASFGRYEVIQEYLDRAVGPGKFSRDNITTPSQYGLSDGCAMQGGKVPMLEVDYYKVLLKMKLSTENACFAPGTVVHAAGSQPEGFAFTSGKCHFL